MGSNYLFMGATATTVGIGDVTGYVKRTTFIPDVEYTFGNQFTSIFFPNIGTLPSEMTLKISIGNTPSWKANAVKRFYDLIQTGGSNTQAVINGHYLDSELNGNDENSLFDLTYIFSVPILVERGRSNFNTTENWISLSNANLSNISSGFGAMEFGFGCPVANVLTWNGSISTSWTANSNWTPNDFPNSSSIIIIPDAANTNNDPILPASSTISTLTIQSGGILNASSNAVLTLAGASGVWSNQGGTFNASSSAIIITNAAATINGTTNFNDITINSGAALTPTTGAITRIAGTLTNSGTLDARYFRNTIEYNGTAQTVILPNGALPGYYNLILSGSGIKTLPVSAFIVDGSFSATGTSFSTAASSITIKGDVAIENGATFETGNYNHSIGRNFINNGTFTAASGTTTSFNGVLAQTISGSTTTGFDILDIDNILEVSLASSINIANHLLLSNGSLTVNSSTLGINGTISNPGGDINVSTTSNLSFGGSTALTLNSNLFSTTPSINNLSINRSGGVSLNDQNLTINGTLTLTSGTLTIGENELTIAGNSPVRTSGNVDASNALATITFANSAAVTLPNSFFAGNVNNMTISANGGVTINNDVNIVGILNLSGSNPSATKGSLEMASAAILDMGENATTTGTGDVTGIIRRQHTFSDGVDYSLGNQFTSMNFLNTGVKPTWVKCKVSIGTVPSWRGAAIKRYYSFAQSGGTDRMIVKLHYLDSELNGAETDETKLVFWDAYDPAFAVNNFVKIYPRNHNSVDATNNFIQLTGPAINYLATSSNLDVKQWGLSYTNVTKHVWTGNGSPSYDGDWSLPGNWLGGVPTADDDVLIPKPADLPTDNNGDYPFANFLSAIVSAKAKSIEIEAGANVNGNNYEITIYGDGNAWLNNGTFIPGNGTVIFANGEISKSVNLSGNTQFNNLTISDKTNIVPLINTAISIKGNLICNGNFVSTNENSLIINGAGADQTISGYGTMELSNFVMNNTFANGKLTLEMPVSISKTLTLMNNHIFTDPTNYIEIQSLASVSPEGGSATSYVDGPIRKIGNTAFVFPVGNNSQYAPVSISAADGGGSDSDYFTAYYLNESPSGVYDSTQVEAPIVRVSAMEYWMLDRSGDNNVFVTLGWNARSGGVTSLDDLRIAHWDGEQWTDAGKSATTGNANIGTITSGLMTSFSPFTLATVKKSWSVNPLPIELISFDAKLVNGQTLLNWITATEINNDSFTIERTSDGANFEFIGTVNGAGNSNQMLNYSLIDAKPLIGTSFYRLKQTDFNGAFTYSDLVSINNDAELSTEVKIYPNPSQGKFTIVSNEDCLSIQICDIFGAKLMEQKPASRQIMIDASNLPNGTYFVKITMTNKSITKKITITR